MRCNVLSLAGIALVASVVDAQRSNSATTIEACASVSSMLASYASASPSATARFELPAEVAYNCSQSAPIITEDALNLVDGLTAYVQWQSTLAYLKNPPEGYLLAGVDLIGGMQQLRDQVAAGAFSSEVDFQTNLTNLIGQAHDGHLLFLADALNVFIYERAGIGSLVSISTDGTSIPQVYALSDLTAAAGGLNTDWEPSPITMMDGQNVTHRLKFLAENQTIGFQDPDALYNSLFASLANPTGNFLANFNTYTGPSISAVFANGTSQTYQNVAFTKQDFTGISSGTDFYEKFCNATNKLNALENPAAVTSAAPSTATSAIPVATPTSTNTPGFPSPVVSSPDGTVAGYFLSGTGFDKTAVLQITQEAESDQLAAQTALTQFLAACRKNSMETLVIDVQNNPGGSILLGYEYFKQLFPSLDPYAAGNFRAQPQLDVLGSFITVFATAALESDPSNITLFESAGGFSVADAKTWLDESNQNFDSWAALYGPRTIHNDNFTNVVRRNISDVNYDEQATGFGFVVSGYGDNTSIAPQPFKAENMILLTDGQCSSSCTTFGHLMKWQGKVKSVTMGGRPQPGPMQYIGGVKGSQVFNLPDLLLAIDGFYQFADDASIKTANTTGLKTLFELGDYVQLRSSTPVGVGASEAVTFNLENSIAEGDATTTPLQFVYEAADCRLWWQAEDLLHITNMWERVAANAFGLNGTRVFGQCVDGSTGAPSSLSGNKELFDDGKADNVTTFENDQLPPASSSSSRSSSGGGSRATSTARGSSPSSTGTANDAVRAGPMSGLVVAAWFGAVVLS